MYILPIAPSSLTNLYLQVLFDENKQKFLNPWLVCILKHCGVMRQIPGLTSLPLTLTAKKSTKIKFRTTRYIAILITGIQIL